MAITLTGGPSASQVKSNLASYSAAPKAKAPVTNSVAKPGALEKLSSTPAFKPTTLAAGTIPQLQSGGAGTFTPAPYSPTANTTPQIASNTKSSTSSGSGGFFSSAIGALKNAFSNSYAGSGNASADNGVNNSASVFGAMDGLYNGKPATNSVTYSSGQRPTLEGQAQDAKNQATRSSIENQDRLKSQVDALTGKAAEMKTADEVKRAAFLADQEKKKADMIGGAVDENGNIIQNAPQEETYMSDPEISNIERQLQAIQEEYAKTQAKSPEEMDNEAQLRNLLASKELGLQAVSEQPIPLGFITGQQSAIERRAATQAQPLQNRLADMQARRAAASDVVKAKLSAAEGLANRTNAFVSERKKDKNLLAKEARDKANEQFNLAAGQTRYDSKGNIIASMPAAPKAVGNYTSTNIPNDVQSDLTADITSGASLEQLLNAYPDVSPAFIRSHFNSLRSKTGNSSTSTSSRPQ